MFKTTAQPTSGGLLLLLLAATLLGTVGIAAALWNRVLPTPPLTLTCLRLGVAAPCLLALAGATTHRNPFRVARSEWVRLTALGLAMAACHSLFFLAIPLAGVTLVVVISLCSAPVIVALLSVLLFRERMSRRVGVSLVLGLIGTGVLVLGGSAADGLGLQATYLGGALLALGSGGAYAGFIVLSRQAAQAGQMPGAQTVALAFTVATLILLPIAATSGTLQLDLPGAVWLLAIYMGLVPTALAYFLIQRALRTTSATTAAIITLLEPAVAAGLAGLVLGEAIGVMTGAGALLLAVSVWLLARPTRQP